MESRKLAVVQKYLNDTQKEKIRECGEALGFTVDFFDGPETARGKLADAEIIFTQFREVLQDAPALRWCASSNAGVDPFLVPGVFASDQAVLTNGAGAYGVTISEHIVMVALMLLRRMGEYQEAAARHEWLGGLGIRSIHGSRVTIMGTGDIGRTTAGTLKAMGASRIVGLNHSGRMPEGAALDETARSTEAESYLPETDILILCMPDTPETRGILSRQRISLLPEHGIVINVGRGSAVDQNALRQALTEHRIGGAALDVVVPEPLPAEDPLWETENLILTQHISGNMTLGYTADRSVELFCDNLRRYAAGEPLHHVVDRIRGY